MWILRLLFSVFGRINRAKFWLGFGIVYAVFAAGMTGFLTEALPKDDWSRGIVGAAMVAGVLSLFLISVKRLHDLNRSGWWVLSGIVLLSLSSSPQDDPLRGIPTILLLMGVVLLGALKGTPGPNAFGPDPLAGKAVKTPEEESAFEKGRDFSNQLFGVFDTFMKERFEPMRERYLEVFRRRVRESMQATDAPPLTAARVEYQSFLENVRELEQSMLSEIRQYMDEWLDVAQQIGVGGETEKAFATRVSNFTADLSLTGLNVLTDYAVPLKDADTAWRRANPERAKDFPEPA